MTISSRTRRSAVLLHLLTLRVSRGRAYFFFAPNRVLVEQLLQPVAFSQTSMIESEGPRVLDALAAIFKF